MPVAPARTMAASGSWRSGATDCSSVATLAQSRNVAAVRSIDDVAMAAGDLSVDRFSEARCVGEVEFAGDSHVRPVRAEGFGRH